MSSGIPFAGISSTQIEKLVLGLESLTDGALAVDLLIACGNRAIAPLEEFLLHGKPRTIAVSRCRAVRALGGVGARETLLAYFDQVELPRDPVALFAEDAVRSAVAHELICWRQEEVFLTLLRAARQRATLGLIEALGELGRSEAIPLLFESLEDDICRNAAFTALCQTPEEARQYAILTVRRATQTNLTGPEASRRRRAVAELFRKLGISREEWQDLSRLLEDDDPTVVISVASAGFRVALQEEFPDIIRALFRVAHKLNWLQEDEMIHLLDEHKELARSVAGAILADLRAHGEHVNWLLPAWRILGHFEQLEPG
jgi:HEAT repeat protein